MSSSNAPRGKRAAGPVGQFFKKKPVRIALRAIGGVFKCILTILLIGVITASIVGCVMVVYVVTSFNGSEGIPDLKNISLNETSIIYTMNQETGEYEEYQRVQGANSIWTSLDEIPLNMQNAIIAIEDKRFREHYGVDWKRTVAAFANLVLPGNSQKFGGSTITQQLIKNLSKDDDVKISRKIREIFRAIEMERNYATKDEILEAYLNILPLSGNIVGVGAAANYYFAKDVQDLSLAECALIAGITQNPSKYNPYLHPDNIKQRQKVVLSEMYKLGFITEDEYKQAYNQELVFKNGVRIPTVQDYYNDLLTEDVIQALMDNYGYTREYAAQMFFYGGLRIYSYENPELQKKAEDIFADDANFPAHIKSDKEDPQGAITVIDYDGRLVATVGGRGKKEANRILNRAVTSTRQPGSSMKPIAVYAPAIDLNLITYSTIMQDKPITLENGDSWPNNYGNYRYGSMPIEEAIQRSLNTIPAQLIEQLTPRRSFDFLVNSLHLTTLVESRVVNGEVKTDVVPALSLGGLTDGVRCIEMAAAYAVFGNGGLYNKPVTFYQVRQGEDGPVILENTPANVRVLSEDTSYVMNRLLQRVITGPYGTARGSGIGNFETFGKTGTTNDDKDAYFVGGTPYYVAACWTGYDNNQTLRYTTYARSLWKKTMDALHQGLEPKSFDSKGTTVEKTYCYDTGMIATPGCPRTAVGVYKADNVPGECTLHGGGGETTAAPTTTTEVETPPTPAPTTTTTQAPTTTTQTPTTTTTTNTTAPEPDPQENQEPES